MSAPDSATHPDLPAQTVTAANAVAAEAKNPTLAGAFTAEQAAAPVVTEIINEAPAIVNETRRGFKTTEFWGIIAAAVATVGPLDVSNKHALILSGLAVFYAIARGLAKAGSPNVTPSPSEVEPTNGP